MLLSPEVWGVEKTRDFVTQMSGQISGLLLCGAHERIASGEISRWHSTVPAPSTIARVTQTCFPAVGRTMPSVAILTSPFRKMPPIKHRGLFALYMSTSAVRSSSGTCRL